jgi:transposase InsO family protein
MDSRRIKRMKRRRHTPEQIIRKLRDELLDVEAFATLLEAKTLAEDYRIDDDTYRPHSSLGYRTPASFAAEWAHQPTGIT